MKRKYSILIIAIIILILVYKVINNENYIEKDKMSNDLMTLKETIIANHPSMQESDQIKSYVKFIDKLIKELPSKQKINQFYFIVSKALAYLNDGHTTIDYYQDDGDFLDLDIIWIGEDLYINKSTDILHKGDKIIKIGNYNCKDLLNKMKDIIPADNNGWLKYRIEQLLPQKKYLQYLGLIDQNNQIDLVINRKNNTMEKVSVKLDVIERKSKEFKNYYTIDSENSTAIMYLYYLEHNDETREFLEAFFTQVKDNNINKVILDLRESPGGDSLFISDLIKYYDVESYVDLNYIMMTNKKKEELLFIGDTYILISKKTFSSSSALAAVYKYNKLGIIVGEPTGTKVHSFGNSKSYMLSNSKIIYKVATMPVKNPLSQNNQFNDAIYPDIYITLRKEDLINETDFILERILNNE